MPPVTPSVRRETGNNRTEDFDRRFKNKKILFNCIKTPYNNLDSRYKAISTAKALKTKKIAHPPLKFNSFKTQLKATLSKSNSCIANKKHTREPLKPTKEPSNN